MNVRRIHAADRTISDRKAAGRKVYSPDRGLGESAKHWRSSRQFGVHSSTAQYRREFNASNRQYLAAQDGFECYLALDHMSPRELDDLAALHGIAPSLNMKELALRLAAKRFPDGQVGRALAWLEEQRAERRRLRAEARAEYLASRSG